MNRRSAAVLAAFALLAALSLLDTASGLLAESDPGPPVLHVVLFAWNPGMSASDEAQFLADSRRLLAAIPGVQEVRGGRNQEASRTAVDGKGTRSRPSWT